MAEKRQKSFIIEPREEQRARLAAMLEDLGHRCFPFSSCKDALDGMDRERADLIFIPFTDNADEIRSYIQQFKRTAPYAAVVVTMQGATDPVAARLVRCGADGFIPCNADEQWVRMQVAVILERLRMDLDRGGRIRDLDHKLENKTLELGRSKMYLEQNFNDTIKAFVGLIETRDRYTGSHMKRVATFSRLISKRYDVNERVQREIEIGALLHDIGKMAIPEQLLIKTRDYFMFSRLTVKEQTIFKRHPVIGQEVMEMVDVLNHLGPNIRHHHENFDGSGYPDGLSGFVIPLGARIIHVVDAYDRIVYGSEKVKQKGARALFLKHLRKYNGQIYDPEVTRYFIDLLREMMERENAREKRLYVEQLEPGMVLSRDVLTRAGVLLLSQYESISENDIKRFKRFQRLNLILEGIYIYESPSFAKPPQTGKSQEKQLSRKSSEEVGFDKVCRAIDDTREFHTLPDVYYSAMNLLSDPKSTRSDLADVLKRDIVILLRILRLVNSPLFGIPRRITTIEDAIPLLGFNEIRHIVSAIPIMEDEDESPDDVFKRKAFWRHSVGCGVIARLIGEQIGVPSSGEYFTAGLLHDIGKMVLDQLFPDEFRSMLNLVREKSVYVRKAERGAFGRPHQEVGEYLLSKWNIPEVLRDAVRSHHNPVDSTIDPTLASAVHLADIITHMLRIGGSGELDVPRLEDFAERQLGIALTDLEHLVPEIDEQLKKSEDMLSIEV